MEVSIYSGGFFGHLVVSEGRGIQHSPMNFGFKNKKLKNKDKG